VVERERERALLWVHTDSNLSKIDFLDASLSEIRARIPDFALKTIEINWKLIISTHIKELMKLCSDPAAQYTGRSVLHGLRMHTQLARSLHYWCLAYRRIRSLHEAYSKEQRQPPCSGVPPNKLEFQTSYVVSTKQVRLFGLGVLGNVFIETRFVY
jgi:hypothetical protein